LEKADIAVLVTDLSHVVLYSNRKANDIFQYEFHQNDLLELPSHPNLVQRLFSDSFQHELIEIGEEYVMVKRQQLMNSDEIIGFFFECRTASSISEIGSKLSSNLSKSGLYANYRFEDIIFMSASMKKCLITAQAISKTNHAVLITGETGSGKELFAQSIHNASARSSGTFVAVNCAAFSESLLESELFGYEGGAFTGARKEGKIGLFELANKGTIFLDEIGDMPLSLQAKLLRALQERKIMRVGSNTVIDIDIRVLSATNKNLNVEIEKRRFRADLYYRLSVFTIHIPSLRERREDILILFHIFSASGHRMLTTHEEKKLLEYDWPGNVRELRNAAIYFDTIGNLDCIAAPKYPARKLAYAAAKEEILEVLEQYKDTSLGRARILSLLRDSGVMLSEKQFESVVRELVEEGIVTRGRGRKGIKIMP